MLARDWRGGELGVLVMALVLAVGTVSGISAFTTRLQNALEQESHRFLAADLVVRSARDMPDSWPLAAERRGLRRAYTLTFPSMVYAGDDAMYLASVKAVSDAYPLRGKLTFSAEPFGPVSPAASGPGRGEVWLDSRLFPLLDVAVGQRVGIGEAEFLVTAAARTEPDQGASFYGYGPRVLMHYDDIPATGVVQEGSRVEFRQLYGGDAFGNISCRLGDSDSFLISGSQTGGLAHALPGHFTCVDEIDLTTNSVVAHGPVPPSSESLTHGAVYALNPQIRCVVHGHSPQLWNRTVELHLPATVPEIAYGTPAMARAIAQLYKENGHPRQAVFSMLGHEDGIVAFAPGFAQIEALLRNQLSSAGKA